MAARTSIEALSVAGEGNMNIVRRAHLDDGATLILKQAVPWVAKYPDIPAPIERADMEYAFYQQLTAELRARTCALVGYAADHHLLCLADLGEAQDCIDCYQNHAETVRAHIPELLQWLTLLHRQTARDFPANTAMRQLNHAHIFDIPLQADNGLTLSDVLVEAREQFLTPDIRARLAHLGDLYLGRTSSPRASLLHGDFYPGSWVHGPAGIIVIDPEFAFVGAAEFDLGVFAAHMLMSGLAPTDIEACLGHYPDLQSVQTPLVWQFAGAEVMRRLLGVAQLPLAASEAQKAAWLGRAHDWLLTG